MVNAQDDSDDAAARLWKSGTDLTGALAGATIGAVAGGPIGAIVGAGAGSAFGLALKEFAHRLLGRREQVRIGAAFQYASAAFDELTAAGHSPRTDGFFSTDKTGRSAADEMIEGVLIAAQRQHEERKVEYFGYLLTNLAFSPQMDRYLASWAIKTAEELTWAQLVLMAVIGAEDKTDVPDVEIKRRPPTRNAFSIHEQLADLGYGRRDLIYGEPDKTERLQLSKPNIRLREQKFSRGGTLLHGLMWLDRIPQLDRREVLRALVEGAEIVPRKIADD